MTDQIGYLMGSPIKSIRRAFSEAATMAGIPWATPHTLKHSAISWLAENGFTVDQISDLTATHPNAVRRVYRKFSPDYLNELATSLGERLDFATPFAKPKPVASKRTKRKSARTA